MMIIEDAVPHSGVDLSVDLAVGWKQSLHLRNPVMVASGTFGYGTEYEKLVEIQRLGAIVSKGITLHPRRGNPTPRIAETPAGMLNAIGLQNIGIRRVIREMAPLWASWRVPVIVNLAGDSLEEFATMAEMVDGVNGIAGVELNISCPNVRAGGALVADDPFSAAEITRAVRACTSLPLVVKLSPHAEPLEEVAQAVEEAGANAISLVNTFVGMKIDIRARKPFLANVTGGLSGPAIRPLALWAVYRVAGAVRVPVVGIGGITSAEDALEFIMAGAAAVQVGTVTFVQPDAAMTIAEGIAQFMAEEGFTTLSQLVGAARPPAHQTPPARAVAGHP